MFGKSRAQIPVARIAVQEMGQFFLFCGGELAGIGENLYSDNPASRRLNST